MKKILLFCFSFVFVLSAWAQDRVITGKVTSAEDGTALPGVNIVVKGSTIGTATDSDGKYSLGINKGAVLFVSFIGYATAEIAVGEQTIIDVSLKLDAKQLSEVVVVGYGTQEKRDITGNVAQISSASIQNLPVASIEQSMQGKAAGVFIESQNGKLGQGVKVRIRGASSLSASNQPLYVVDGIPITSATEQRRILWLI
jgi:TonB-dependent starch-binding outer membrane protein SusC